MEKHITPLTYLLASATRKTAKICLNKTLIEEGPEIFLKGKKKKSQDSLSEVS
jgi:hypothetical protein